MKMEMKPKYYLFIFGDQSILVALTNGHKVKKLAYTQDHQVLCVNLPHKVIEVREDLMEKAYSTEWYHGDAWKYIAKHGITKFIKEFSTQHKATTKPEWLADGTALCPPTILVKNLHTNVRGSVTEFSKEEWTQAFHASSVPYLWHDASRVKTT